MITFLVWKSKGSKLSIPHKTTVGQIKTTVQCVENPKGLGGVIIYDQETFTMSKQHLFDPREDNWNIQPRILKGNICGKFAQEHPVDKHTLLTQEALADELSSNQAQISIQCKDNSEVQDGMVLFETEDFPMVNILCPTIVEDRPDDAYPAVWIGVKIFPDVELEQQIFLCPSAASTVSRAADGPHRTSSYSAVRLQWNNTSFLWPSASPEAGAPGALWKLRWHSALEAYRLQPMATGS
ncbi:hypothetical protein Q8A67_022925 [Cirrhinus molitorella]|uniref:Uncharacterized protein n=1 Tax=Cirrhinus molitorella TaxID=172907 RepID=A0AA88P7M6_9TELE|nr:hypothetical protein Q8A67_022925 [Cirrhinus molitorella]